MATTKTTAPKDLTPKGNQTFLFDKSNYMWMIGGVIVIILGFILFNEPELQVMVNKYCREISIVTLPVTVDHPVPFAFRGFKPQENQNIDQQNDLRCVFVKIFHPP